LKESGLTQREFADRLGVWESVVSMWISRERTMSLEKALNAAHILGCAVEDLHETEVVPLKKRKGQ
jgi:transcriptional regulator with XRE-family HTH domain